MPESDGERQQRAVDLAFKRGSEMAEINGRLAGHDQQFARINGAIEGLQGEVHGVSGRLDALTAKVDQNIAVQAARAQDAERAVTAQVSSRQFFVGLAGAVIAIGLLLVTTLAAAGAI